MRFCVGYHRLNSVTVPDFYPLPLIDDLLHAAKRTPYMSTIDQLSDYHQIKVREYDIDKHRLELSVIYECRLVCEIRLYFRDL